MVMCPKQQQNENWSQVGIEKFIVRGRNLPRTNSTKFETQFIFAKKQQNEHTPELPSGWVSMPPGVCSFSWNLHSFPVNSQKLGVQTPQNVEFE